MDASLNKLALIRQKEQVCKPSLACFSKQSPSFEGGKVDELVHTDYSNSWWAHVCSPLVHVGNKNMAFTGIALLLKASWAGASPQLGSLGQVLYSFLSGYWHSLSSNIIISFASISLKSTCFPVYLQKYFMAKKVLATMYPIIPANLCQIGFFVIHRSSKSFQTCPHIVMDIYTCGRLKIIKCNYRSSNLSAVFRFPW